MNREEIKRILGENASEELTSSLLNAFHTAEKANSEKINSLQSELSNYSDYNDVKQKLNQYETEKMSETEKLERMKAEIEQNLKESRITKNKAKVMAVLSSLNIDDAIIDSIVTEDETRSLDNANKILNKINSIKEEVERQTKDSLINMDLKPAIGNANPNEDSNVMTLDKFNSLSMLEQKQWKDEHIDEYREITSQK